MPQTTHAPQAAEPALQTLDTLLMNITRWPPHATTLRSGSVPDGFFDQLRLRCRPRQTADGTDAGSFAFYAWGRAWHIGVSFRREGTEQVAAVVAEDLPPVPMN
ncbi:MAG: hypothetical protein ACFCVE_08280 [Phycisphaerae bacterium]